MFASTSQVSKLGIDPPPEEATFPFNVCEFDKKTQHPRVPTERTPKATRATPKAFI